MLYVKCPTCRQLLGNKQLLYETELQKICDDPAVVESDKDELKIKLVNSLGLERYCCKMRLMTYKRLIDFVK
ncbi:MAG: hypothetical protein Edafosvirus40_4 [Edafosvirus sp.]|uniref:DNA-directed RNA polymerase subunit N n=1 Tax=Edafosvirus sp. TaxID=2487765 RepID=A0A3G4ZZT1_9VIRU|nr:MAG: hypothetical protein Edafosvirus40_4 [Edafosvirus sp.]